LGSKLLKALQNSKKIDSMVFNTTFAKNKNTVFGIFNKWKFRKLDSKI